MRKTLLVESIPYLILRRPQSGRLEGRTTTWQGALHRRAFGPRLVRRQAELGRQAAQHRGSRSRRRFDRDRTAVQLDQVLDQRQAEPGAGFASVRLAAL